MEKRKLFRAAVAIFLVATFLFTGCSTSSDELKTSTLLANDSTTDGWTECWDECDSDGNCNQECNSSDGSTDDEWTECVSVNCDENGENCEQECKSSDGSTDDEATECWTDCDENGENCEQECKTYTDDNNNNYNNDNTYEYNEEDQHTKTWNEEKGCNDICNTEGNCWDDCGGEGWDDGKKDCFGEGNDECRENELKHDYREIERMQREIKHMIKKGEADETELQSLSDQLTDLEGQLDGATTHEEVETIREQVRAIQDELSTFRMASEIERLQKEIEREEKHLKRDKEYLNEMLEIVNDEQKETVEELLVLLERKIELKYLILAEYEAGGDWETTYDLQIELEDTYWAIDDGWWELEEIREEQFTGQMIEDVKRGIEKFLEHEYPHLTDAQKEKADEIIEIANELIAKAEEAIENDDMEALKDILFRLDELGMKAERLFGKPKIDFNELGLEDIDDDFENISKDMSYEDMMEIVEKILAANPEMIQDILSGDPVLAEKTMKILDKIPEESQNDFLEKKASLGQLYDEILATNPSIADYKEEILGYNYYGEALDELIKLLEEVRDGTLTLDEVISKVEELKKESKEAKHNDKISKFSDYDTNDWYYEAAENLEDIKGIEGEFKGGNFITSAEATKMVLAKNGIQESTGTPAYPVGDHWVKGYYSAAEQMGVTLLEPDHLITRGEMARLIVEVTLGAPNQYSTSSFADLDASDPYFNYLETLNEYGVITGDSVEYGLPTVRSGDNINRAETAKVIGAAYENMQYETIETGELDYLLEGIGEETATQ